jgi:hypothetical protein
LAAYLEQLGHRAMLAERVHLNVLLAIDPGDKDGED